MSIKCFLVIICNVANKNILYKIIGIFEGSSVYNFCLKEAVKKVDIEDKLIELD